MPSYALTKNPYRTKGTPIVPAHAGYGFLLFLTQRRQAFGFGSKNGAHTTLRGGITNMSCRVHQTFVIGFLYGFQSEIHLLPYYFATFDG